MSTASSSRSLARQQRFRQYSLRSLLGLMLVCGVALALWTIFVEPYRRQHRLIEAIKELEGSVSTEAVETPLSVLFGSDYFVDIVSIDLLKQTPIDDAWMVNLRDTPRLRELYLRRAAIGDAGMAYVGRLEDLQSLGLIGTKVTNAGLVHVSGLHKLEFLAVNFTEITDAGLASLANLKRLKELYLRRCTIFDAGLLHLQGLTDLATLDLSDTQVGDEGVARLTGLTKLARLWLDNTEVTKACLADLRKLPALEEVSLSGTHIFPSVLRDALPALDERRLAKKLAEPAWLDFVETPLEAVKEYLEDYHNVEIWLDRRTLNEAGIRVDDPVTIKDLRKPLREALHELLDGRGLKCVMGYGVLVITTKENANDWRARLILKSGEKLSRKLSTSLYAEMPIQFVETPLLHVLQYASDVLNCQVGLAEGVFPVGFDQTEMNHNSRLPAADGLELLFHELDVHGAIENNAIVIYPGPAPR
jgi:hypothetical protein